MTENLESNLIVIKGAFDKTPGQEYKIAPCKMPNGSFPACVRKTNANGDMILTDEDIKKWNAGEAVFIPEDQPIVVHHGSTFDLDDPLQKAQWEAIKNSRLIAKERDERDINGDLTIDGGKSIIDAHDNPRGRYGLAELYIERPGRSAQARVKIAKLIHEAEDLVLNDSLSHQIMICKLFEKDMSHAHPSDVEDFLWQQASKNPEKVIKFYNTEESSNRLLVLVAQDKGVVVKKQDGLYYADIKLGSSLDFAVDYLKASENKALRDAIKSETYPELEKKKAAAKSDK